MSRIRIPMPEHSPTHPALFASAFYQRPINGETMIAAYATRGTDGKPEEEGEKQRSLTVGRHLFRYTAMKSARIRVPRLPTLLIHPD